ncbi:MAG: ABC transporter permease [Candidatus Tectomicrobia bacterium]|nr:ABC transporter permease [Candidatus Tectomicrobia bacterium]
MLGYIIRRVLLMIPLLFGVSLLTFIIMKYAPGDPVSQMLSRAEGGGGLDGAERERLKEQLGLHRPVHIQYFLWLNQILHGNMGESLISHRPVTTLIKEKLPNTLKLAGISLVLTLTIALPLGILSAVRQYSPIDYSLTFFSFLGISIPTFWLSLMLMYIFALKLGFFPTRGMISFDVGPGWWEAWVDTVKHYTLPTISMTLVGLAGYMRYQRSSMLEVIRQEYIRTARAKGLSEMKVIFKHAWLNALIPIITLLGYVFANLVEGSVVVELIFSWPGMGNLGISAIHQRDYPLIMGIVLLSAVMIVVGTLVSDILYAWVDPRVRYEKR